MIRKLKYMLNMSQDTKTILAVIAGIAFGALIVYGASYLAAMLILII